MKLKLRFSLLISAIFLILLGIPIYSLLDWSLSSAERESRLQIENGHKFSSRLGETTFDSYVTRTFLVAENLLQNKSFIDSLRKKETKELTEFLEDYYDRDDLEFIDFLFLRITDKKDVINVSSSIFEIAPIIKKVEAPTFFNKSLVFDSAQIEGRKVHFSSLSLPILHEETGELLGSISLGIIINNNFNLMQKIQDVTEALNVTILEGSDAISQLNKVKDEKIFETIANQDLYVDDSRILSSFKLDYEGSKKLKVLLEFKNKSHKRLIDHFNEKKRLFSLIVLILAGFFFVLVRFLIHGPLKKLVELTQLKDVDEIIKDDTFGIIYEFQTLGQSLSKTLTELSDLNKGLEVEVDARTQEIRKKNKILNDKIDELVSLQKRMIAQEKLASMGTILAGVSHEIKNPLNLILNSSLILTSLAEEVSELKSEEERAEVINSNIDSFLEMSQIITNHAKRATTTIRSMLAKSQGTSYELEKVNVKEHLETNFNFAFKSFTINNKLEITNVFDMKDIGECSLFPIELGQVYINILDNSFYSLAEKSKDNPDFRPIIKIILKEEGNNFIVKIWDNGNGIPSDIVTEIFEAFNTSKPTGTGTGLGLSVSKDIITKHNGLIAAQSKEGEYAEFTISIPKNLEEVLSEVQG